MTEQEILDRLSKIFFREFEIEPEKITPAATVYEDLELDSLDSIDLIVALENEFGMKVDREKDEQTIRAIRTIADVIGYIQAKLGQ